MLLPVSHSYFLFCSLQIYYANRSSTWNSVNDYGVLHRQVNGFPQIWPNFEIQKSGLQENWWPYWLVVVSELLVTIGCHLISTVIERFCQGVLKSIDWQGLIDAANGFWFSVCHTSTLSTSTMSAILQSALIVPTPLDYVKRNRIAD